MGNNCSLRPIKCGRIREEGVKAECPSQEQERSSCDFELEVFSSTLDGAVVPEMPRMLQRDSRLIYTRKSR